MSIQYRDNAPLTVVAAIELYDRSTLGERRVGISRTLTDFTYVAYLADLAVDVDYQKTGIGRQLIAHTRARLQPECMVVLLSAPQANDDYPKVGLEHNPRAWVMKGEPS
jgi:predicted N-acetyltransferase YhbS